MTHAPRARSPLDNYGQRFDRAAPRAGARGAGRVEVLTIGELQNLVTSSVTRDAPRPAKAGGHPGAGGIVRRADRAVGLDRLAGAPCRAALLCRGRDRSRAQGADRWHRQRATVVRIAAGIETEHQIASISRTASRCRSPAGRAGVDALIEAILAYTEIGGEISPRQPSISAGLERLFSPYRRQMITVCY
jgi:hypothetical protein